MRQHQAEAKLEANRRELTGNALSLAKSDQLITQLKKDLRTILARTEGGSSSYPGLLPAEIRLCAMLRLQLTTKEIAEMIKRSTRTIENTRNSIRKKMGLQSGDNLVQHLLND